MKFDEVPCGLKEAHRGEAAKYYRPEPPQTGNSQDKLPDKRGGVLGNFKSKGIEGGLKIKVKGRETQPLSVFLY